MGEGAAFGENQVDRCDLWEVSSIDSRKGVQRCKLLCGQQRLLVAVQSCVDGLNFRDQAPVACSQRTQIIREIGEILPKRCENCRMVELFRSGCLQGRIVLVKRIHQHFECCRVLLICFQRVIRSRKRLIVRGQEIIVMETIIIRLGFCKVFAAVARNQRVRVIRFANVNLREIASVEGVILANGDFIVNCAGCAIVRCDVEHGNGVPARFTEHILQISACIRDRRCFGQLRLKRSFIRLLADKERDIFRALAAAFVCDTCAGNDCGERSLVAHLLPGRSAHADLCKAVRIIGFRVCRDWEIGP